jgi:ATP-dependent Lhr-like helicase
VAPISIFPRDDAGWLLTTFCDDSTQDDPARWLSAVAQTLRHYLVERGASFFADLVRSTALLPAEVEDGLWELVAAGLVTADGFDNLRALIDPRRRRAEGRERIRRPRYVSGRWTLLRPTTSSNVTREECVDSVVRQLLRRYGLVFRDLLGRESISLPWRDMLIHFRRLEMRGEVRGGRFVSGFTGDQFALPEAVESLRAMRRSGRADGQGIDIKLSAADPLNLAGVILPGPRIPATQTNYVVFRDGIPVRSVALRDPIPIASGTNESLECSVLP